MHEYVFRQFITEDQSGHLANLLIQEQQVGQKEFKIYFGVLPQHVFVQALIQDMYQFVDLAVRAQYS